MQTDTPDMDLHPEITNVLHGMLSSDSIFPFLLVGSAGSGKSTLLARFVHLYHNNSNSNSQSAPASAVTATTTTTDLLHVHAFSELSLADYVAQIKQFCPFRCSIAGRKKIIVMDDADTLPEAMQQIMCSLMDKYKQQVLFIAACTAPRKLAESFQSRFLTLQMAALDDTARAQFFNHLTATMMPPQIVVSDEAAAFLLQIVGTNLKRMVRCVEKMRLYCGASDAATTTATTITLEAAVALCTHIPHFVFDQFLEHTRAGAWMEAANLWYEWHDKGHSTIDLFVAFFEYLKLADNIDEQQKIKFIALLCRRMANFYENEDDLHIAQFAFEMRRGGSPPPTPQSMC